MVSLPNIGICLNFPARFAWLIIGSLLAPILVSYWTRSFTTFCKKPRAASSVVVKMYDKAYYYCLLLA